MFDADTDSLADEIVRAARDVDVGLARLIALVGEFDRREGWARWGSHSCAQWLAWRCSIRAGTAREHVRVARSLRALPRMAERFASGALSYAKVRALTRIATPDNESLLLSWAEAANAADLERIVQGHRLACATTDPGYRHRRRSLRHFYDEDGMLVIIARLEPDQGALALAAIEQAEGRLGADGDTDVPAETARPTRGSTDPIPLEESHPAERRRADAFILMAELSLAPEEGGGLSRPLVVLHVGATGGWDNAVLDHGPPVHAGVARRIACDADIVTVDHAAGGLSVGRKTRVLPRRMRRALRARDRGCRFPACRSLKADAHHIKHWADGGETSMDNLVLLCRRHHSLIHDHGFSVARGAAGLVFERPDGVVINAASAVSA